MVAGFTPALTGLSVGIVRVGRVHCGHEHAGYPPARHLGLARGHARAAPAAGRADGPGAARVRVPADREARRAGRAAAADPAGGREVLRAPGRAQAPVRDAGRRAGLDPAGRRGERLLRGGGRPGPGRPEGEHHQRAGLPDRGPGGRPGSGSRPTCGRPSARSWRRWRRSSPGRCASCTTTCCGWARWRSGSTRTPSSSHVPARAADVQHQPLPAAVGHRPGRGRASTGSRRTPTGASSPSSTGSRATAACRCRAWTAAGRTRPTCPTRSP